MNKTLPEVDGLLTKLHKTLDDRLSQGRERSKGIARLKFLAESIEQISADMLAVGDAALVRLEEGEQASFEDYLVCYEWADCAKSFLILYRDVLFEEQKAWLQVTTQKTNLSKFERLVAESQEVLTEATLDFQGFLGREKVESGTREKRLSRWRLQENPWPVYREQIVLFPNQASDLMQQCESLWNASGVFVVIYSQVMENFLHAQKEIEETQEEVQQLIGKIETEENYPLKQVVSALDSLHHKLISNKILDQLSTSLDLHLDKLPKETRVFVSSQNGTLFYKDLDLQRLSRSWIESEVISEIYQLNTIEESIQNKVNLSKVNLSSRIALMKEEKDASAKDEIISALQKFLKSLKKSEQEVLLIEKLIRQKLKTEFDLGKIAEDNFLPVSMQYTLQQYREGERWKFVRDWFLQQGRSIRQFRKNVREEGALSISEKLVRVVIARSCEPGNSLYTNMFLTKGYIGDSFLVGRSAELRRIASVVENWKLGFRGSLMITGTRFSGKTLLGELISQHHFPTNTIRLKPQSKIQLAGRFFDIDFDIRAVLDFVVKNTLNKPMMVWIDDLEYWENDKISIAENVHHLFQIMDQYTSRLFFAVSFSNWMKDRLQEVFEVERVFQSEINVDRMEAEEVEQAILTRHSATHTELLNADKEEMTPQELHKKIGQIYRQVNGNIGHALQTWAYTIRKYDDERVYWKDASALALPDFLSMDASLLLRDIMLEKRTNEYRLRKKFGPAFKDQYQVILQRLSSLGIIERGVGGWLKINPFLANDIGRQLEKKINFRFQQRNVLIENLKR